MWKNLVGKKLSKLQFKNKLVSSYGLELIARRVELEGSFWFNFVEFYHIKYFDHFPSSLLRFTLQLSLHF